MITTSAVTATRSGTDWTIDVSDANLSEDLQVKDFLILNNTNESFINNDNVTKTSQTVLTYSGTDIGTNQALEVRRNSPVSRYQEINYAALFSSSVYNTEIDNILRRLFEITLFGSDTSNIFIPAPVNESYGSSWETDTIKGRTANRLYEEFEKRTSNIEDEDISGNWDFTSGGILVSTQSADTDDTSAASTAFVQQELGSKGLPSGGLAGAVLTKDSNSDYDVSWSTANRQVINHYYASATSQITLNSIGVFVDISVTLSVLNIQINDLLILEAVTPVRLEPSVSSTCGVSFRFLEGASVINTAGGFGPAHVLYGSGGNITAVASSVPYTFLRVASSAGSLNYKVQAALSNTGTAVVSVGGVIPRTFRIMHLR